MKIQTTIENKKNETGARRRSFIGALALAAVVLATTSVARAQAAADTGKPNVIIIFVDDLGWTDLSCYGSTFHETPNIDRLGQAGRHVHQSVCFMLCLLADPRFLDDRQVSPTSRLSPISFSRTNAAGENSAETHIPVGETTIGEAFQQAGYRTGYIGKWHVGSEKIGMPKQHGFDWQMATAKHGLPASYFYPYKSKRLSTADVPDLEDGKPGDYLTDVLTDKGIGFIRETVMKASKPFFLILGHYAVHTPIQARKKLVEKYEAKKKRMYGDNSAEDETREVQSRSSVKTAKPDLRGHDGKPGHECRQGDRCFGRARSDQRHDHRFHLRQRRILHVTESRPTSNYPLRASKGFNYEGGIRIPTFITWPGNISAMKSSDPVITMDIYPTLLELTGCKQLPKQTLDGQSLVPLIYGEKKSLNRPFLAWWFPHPHGHGRQPCQAILKDGWKLVHYIEQNETELYRLDDDEGERTTSRKAEPERTRELLETLNQWVKETRRN